jgi:hypothetical protein
MIQGVAANQDARERYRAAVSWAVLTMMPQ